MVCHYMSSLIKLVDETASDFTLVVHNNLSTYGAAVLY